MYMVLILSFSCRDAPGERSYITKPFLFQCIKTRMLGHRKKATIQRRHDPDDRSHHFEMDNQAFRASIEQVSKLTLQPRNVNGSIS